ncbi:MAG: hypothetical protein J6V25_01530, partial [Oscillospiraceae bacterium]|nr:hypothetical protein [Oscillospiraceae bacterium]
DYVRAAVKQETQALGKIMIEQAEALMDFLAERMPQAVVLDSGALVGNLAPGIDARLSDRWRRNGR